MDDSETITQANAMALETSIPLIWVYKPLPPNRPVQIISGLGWGLDWAQIGFESGSDGVRGSDTAKVQVPPRSPVCPRSSHMMRLVSVLPDRGRRIYVL